MHLHAYENGEILSPTNKFIFHLTSQTNSQTATTMPKQQIKTQPAHNQNDDSYEQQIFQNDQAPSPNQQPHSAMLDQNEEFEIYEDPPYSATANENIKNQFKLEPSQLTYERESSSIDFSIPDLRNIKQQHEQPDTDLEDQIEKVATLLKTTYSRYDQNVLIQMLYEKCFPKNIKAEPLETISERNNLDNLKKMTKAAQIFVDHGYGINIARKYAQKGQEVNPNPYNNMIGKIIKDTWKGIEKQIQKIRKTIRPLNTEQFNQVKTPLINARQWMVNQQLNIFLNIVAYVNGVRPLKPSSRDFEKFYDYLIPKTKGKKPNLGKHNSKKAKREKSGNDQSSDEFTVPKHQERKIIYGKPSKYLVKRDYDD